MRDGPNVHNTCGCIVTYRPGATLAANFAPLMSRVPKWIIVDNRSPDEDRERLRTIASGAVELIENPDNQGVAVALNQAAHRAGALGFEWLLTFDQDSAPRADLLARLSEAYGSLPDRGRIGMIGSNFVMEGTDRLFYDCRGGSAAVERPTLITSGSILSLQVFSEIGPFREDLFIDGVDSEFCLRLRRGGYKVFAVCEPLMRHSLGEFRGNRMLPSRVRITHHSALRRYYITRNTLVVAREYWRDERAWVKLSLKVLVAGFLGAMVFEQHRWAKLRATVHGVLDAIRGRTGPAKSVGE